MNSGKYLCGSSTFLLILTECCEKTGSLGWFLFSFGTENIAFIVQNEMSVLCYTIEGIAYIIPNAWNRLFTCTY